MLDCESSMLAVLAYVTAFCLYAVLRRCVLTRVVMFTEHKIFKIFHQIPPTDGLAIAFFQDFSLETSKSLPRIRVENFTHIAALYKLCTLPSSTSSSRRWDDLNVSQHTFFYCCLINYSRGRAVEEAAILLRESLSPGSELFRGSDMRKFFPVFASCEAEQNNFRMILQLTVCVFAAVASRKTICALILHRVLCFHTTIRR